MLYRVIYTNPNNVTGKNYTLETNSRARFNEFMRTAKEYNGSYKIISIEKISEAKSNSKKN